MFKNHPKGLFAAAISNMGERFGYYIMNAVLTLFLCSKFGLSNTTATIIYSSFYCGIYILSLFGGLIADRTQNYKGTIQKGLLIMAAGYILLSIPITATDVNTSWLLPLTCLALFLIAFGNGLFKGNLQAIVGQLYDNFEAEESKKGPEALKLAKEKRDSGFQIFYVFINIGGLIAPFVAPLIRSWWLGAKGFIYNAKLPALCHEYLNGTLTGEKLVNYNELSAQSMVEAGAVFDPSAYLEVFNQGVHFSFIASVLAMLISLVIFLLTKKGLPMPIKKTETETIEYTSEEKAAMAKEIKQRLYALFAVLGVTIFFWFSFHQNGASFSLFARDFMDTSKVAPEFLQAINPFFVIILTPVIMWIFALLAKKGKAISTPRKIGIGMGLAALAYIFLAIFSYIMEYPSAQEFLAYPEAQQEAARAGVWVFFVTYFFLTVAELFISPLGLSFVSKVAPKHMLGLCQGLWLGATAVGNAFLFLGSMMYNSMPLWMCWSVFVVICLISMGVMFSMVKWLERVTG
ncbi:MAG: peptide MFS transporter [Paludibacteraceae bacterium]|jgi:POT family proton-dependent oligopeptide transporter|nr:peptide MFS transporter [Paludibacteraceae bacterium]OQC34062.1 MAG: Dipeptide and tripeptide permease B [Bacteroidetes bacterium ADurb.Bin057]HHT61891.1 peptide MFS transporter [Bacteroidales bacterium]MBP9039800.1 peptide MFS transporter [Paludibacteraceae bacterium]HOA46873.1 peptide MFS transporter [Paludibacteraceae bacterium]